MLTHDLVEREINESCALHDEQLLLSEVQVVHSSVLAQNSSLVLWHTGGLLLLFPLELLHQFEDGG